MELVNAVHGALKQRDADVAANFLSSPIVQVIGMDTPLIEQQRILTHLFTNKLSSHPIPCLDTVAKLNATNTQQWLGNFETGVADVVCNLLLF